ncbi:hypothetical protein FOA52_013775 [Chlamydomonas sp. UWO 241]|nr:hypothetical protein FOA52_013775 [Chlamydomonas sp. UWO 241]
MHAPGGPINCIEGPASVDWDDRLGLQQRWADIDKGWRVEVEWRATEYGVGLFAAQDIAAGTTLRHGRIGLNLLQFSSAAEMVAFCRGGEAKRGAIQPALVAYVADYFYGWDPNEGAEAAAAVGAGATAGAGGAAGGAAAAGGGGGGGGAAAAAAAGSAPATAGGACAAATTAATSEEGADSTLDHTQPPQPMWYGLWVPGNGLNHGPEPNVVYRAPPIGGVAVGIDLVAMTDVTAGEQLLDDYRRHGQPPAWAREFAASFGVSMNFSGCNDFV